MNSIGNPVNLERNWIDRSKCTTIQVQPDGPRIKLTCNGVGVSVSVSLALSQFIELAEEATRVFRDECTNPIFTELRKYTELMCKEYKVEVDLK